MDPTTVLLEVRNLTIQFGEDRPVVRNLSFDISAGETLAIVGESGSGKSMTALALLGLLPATATITRGNIYWHGGQNKRVLDLSDLPEAGFRSLRSNEIGMVFQEPLTALNPTQRIGKQIDESIQSSRGKLPKPQRRKLAIHWLEQVQLDEVSRILNAYPHQLSGGQRQRVLIAMAMLAEPKLLIADEPTTALDTVTEAAIISLLQGLTSKKGTALLFISHDLAVVRHLADQLLLLRAGEEMEKGKAATIFSSPTSAYARNLMKLSPRLNFDPQRNLHPQEIKKEQPLLLSATDLSIQYVIKKDWLGRPQLVLRAVDGVNITIERGAFIGLIGESGCGKSSLVRGLTGLITFSNGSIQPPNLNVQMVFQDPFSSLNPVITAGEMIREIVNLHEVDLSADERAARVEALFQSVDLPPATFLHRLPREMSGGQRQRLAIARSLAAKPDLLICDEAVSALDAALQHNIMDLLQHLCREQQLPVLFISHDLALVSDRADRILVMEAGKIVESGSPQQLLNRPQTEITRKLLAAILPT